MFKVGQKVRVMLVSELEKSFNKESFDSYNSQWGFTKGMIDALCGKEFIITDITSDGEVIGHGTFYHISTDVLVPVYRVGDIVEVLTYDELLENNDIDCDGDIVLFDRFGDEVYFSDEVGEMIGGIQFQIERIDADGELFGHGAESICGIYESMVRYVGSKPSALEVEEVKLSDICVGMKVQIKSYDEIKAFMAKFGEVQFGWNPQMTEVLCGKEFIIDEITTSGKIGGHGTKWGVSVDMIKIVDKSEQGLIEILNKKDSEIEKLKRRLKELDSLIPPQKNKIFADEFAEEYFYIETTGGIGSNSFDNDLTDREFVEFGNFFTSEESAKTVCEQQRILRRLRQLAERKNAHNVDFTDRNPKYFIAVGKDGLTIKSCVDEYQLGNVYFSTRQAAEESLEAFEKQIIKYFA